MAYAFLNQQYINGDNAELVQMIERTITEIEIPEGTTTIGAYAFSYCISLNRISIPEGVKSINPNAILGTAITEIVLPTSCERLEQYCLYYNGRLKRISLGDVKNIAVFALGSNVNCKEFDFTRCTTVPTLADTNAISIYSNDTKIIVPTSLYHEWIASTNWSEYADYIVPSEKTPYIDDPDYVSVGLFIENGILKGRGNCRDSVIVVPEEVETVGMEAFNFDSNIEVLILPNREIGVHVSAYSVYQSSLRAVKNIYSTESFTFMECPLEYASFLPGCDYLPMDSGFFSHDSAVLDFSRHTEVPRLDKLDESSVSIGKNMRILVPLALYDEWRSATNWTLLAEHIVAIR